MHRLGGLGAVDIEHQQLRHLDLPRGGQSTRRTLQRPRVRLKGASRIFFAHARRRGGDGRHPTGREGRQDQRRECGPAGQGAPLRVPTRVPTRVDSQRDGSQEPQRPRLFGPRFWLLLLGLLDDVPFLPTGTGPARCGRLQAPRGAPAAIGERFGQAIVRHEALGHGRDRLAAGRVEAADGQPRLTVEATWALTSGRSALKFNLRSCIDAKRSNRAGKSLASGGCRLSAMRQAAGWTRPELLVCGGAPRRNRTGDPILTIDGRPVRGTMRHLAPLYRTTGGSWPETGRAGPGPIPAPPSSWTISCATTRPGSSGPAGPGWSPRPSATTVPWSWSSTSPPPDSRPTARSVALVLCVDLVGSSPIWPAHVGGLVDLDGSRPVPSDRLDDQPDDQARGDVLAPSRWGRAANRSSSAPKGTVKRRHSRSARRDRQIARRSGRLGAPRHAGSRACGAAAPHGRWSALAVRCSTGHRAGRGGGRPPTRRPGRAGPGRCRGYGPRRGRIRSGCGHRARPVGWARPGVGLARME